MRFACMRSQQPIFLVEVEENGIFLEHEKEMEFLFRIVSAAMFPFVAQRIIVFW